jgi:outer membrane lipoprotein-sorting protein
MRKAFGVLLSVLLLQAGAAYALTADEVVARYVDARGGAQKLAALKSLRLTGKAVFGGGDFSLEARWAQLQKRPGMIRSEVTLQGLTAVEAYDGKGAWELQPFQGRREPNRTSADDAKKLAQDADLEGPLVNFRAKGHRVDYLGTEDVDGTQAHKLRVALKDGDVQTIYLDPDSFLPIRIETARRVRGTEQVTETDLGSYAQVAGVWIAFSVESGAKGERRSARFTVEQAEPDVEIDDAVFKFPASGTPVGRAVLADPKAPALAQSTPPPAAKAAPAVIDAGVISGLGARNIGSATMSGRISALAARNEGGKTTLFVGAASGGV